MFILKNLIHSKPLQAGRSLDDVLVCDNATEDGKVWATACDDEGWATALVANSLRLLTGCLGVCLKFDSLTRFSGGGWGRKVGVLGNDEVV